MTTFQPFQQLELLLGQSGNPTPGSFPPNSRYYTTLTATLETEDGSEQVYLSRRFVPQPESLAVQAQYQVSEQDRLDNITAKQLGDPERYWQLCDANRAMRPDELEVVGSKLRIPFPDGISAPQENG